MNGVNFLDGLDLYDNLPVDNEIGTETHLHLHVLVDDWNRLLPANTQPAPLELGRQQRFID